MRTPTLDDLEGESSKFNQSVLLFRRQDSFLTRFQELHDQAMTYDQSGKSLLICYSVFRHAYLISKHAIADRFRERIDKLLNVWVVEFKKSCGKTGITNEDYGKLHNDLYDLVDRLYMAQQKVGMGIKKELYASTYGKLNQAMLE